MDFFFIKNFIIRFNMGLLCVCETSSILLFSDHTIIEHNMYEAWRIAVKMSAGKVWSNRTKAEDPKCLPVWNRLKTQFHPRRKLVMNANGSSSTLAQKSHTHTSKLTNWVSQSVRPLFASLERHNKRFVFVPFCQHQEAVKLFQHNHDVGRLFIALSESLALASYLGGQPPGLSQLN